MSDPAFAIDDLEHAPDRLQPMLLTVRDAARVLAVGRSTLYELIGAGEIVPIHIGRSTRIPVAEVTDYVDRLRAGGNGGTVRSTRRPGPSGYSTRASRPPDKSRRPTA